MRLLHSFAVTCVLLTACGSSNPGPTGGNGSGPMSARIAGTNWTAGTAVAVHAGPGLYSMTGISTGGVGYTMSFQLANIGTTGTYPLGVTPQIFGGTVTVTNAAVGSWSTAINGAAGEIVISTLTDTRIAGSFSFTGTSLSGTVGTLAVTNGVFDVPVTGTAAALPANAGSRVTADINGATFAAGAAASVLTTGASPTLTISANNLTRNMVISLANMTGAGTYAFSAATPVRTLQITGSTGNATATWGTQLAGSSGSVTVTSVSSTRIVGTFTAVLVPIGGGATGTLTVSGAFDMGRL